MKRFKISFFKNKIANRITIGILVLLIIGSIVQFFSPILITFPVKKSFIQINIDRGFNAFFPRDETSMYYFHNSLSPQIITSSNTSYHGMEGLPYFQIWFPHSPKFSLPNFPSPKLPRINLPTPEVSSLTQVILPIQNTRKDHLTTQAINLTFTIPPNYTQEYKTEQSGNTEVINVGKRVDDRDNWMSILIIDSERCEINPNDNLIFSGHTLSVAGKWPMEISKNHARYGSREQRGQACLDNNKTLRMYRYLDNSGGDIETQFDKILETAVYKP